MFGNNLLAIMINLVFFITIATTSHFLGNNLAKPKNDYAIAFTIIALAGTTYIPAFGYLICLIAILFLLFINKRLEYKVAAVAFAISFSIAKTISFLVAHSFFVIPLSSIGTIVPLVVILTIVATLFIIFKTKRNPPSQ